jgi:threonylcarbamoyladenosine tRNA methylthiotransferase MtaB
MGHLHLSLQAGDDLILKRMKRRHSLADAHACVERARAARPDVVFGADIIAGFPTEDEARFQTTLDAVDTLDLTWLHVFPYSERPGTPAAKMPAVSKAERKDRARRLRAAGERRVAAFLQGRVGRIESVLLEEADAQGRMKGRSEQFAPMRVVPGPGGTAGQAGEIVRARVTHVEGGSLVAETQA